MHERVEKRLIDLRSDSEGTMVIKSLIKEGLYPWSGLKYAKATETLIRCKSVDEFKSMIDVNKELINCKGGRAYLAQAIFKGYVVDEAVYCPQKECWNSSESCSVYEKTKIDFEDCSEAELLKVKKFQNEKLALLKLHYEDDAFIDQFTNKEKENIRYIQISESRDLEHAWTLQRSLFPKSYLILKELKRRNGESCKTLRRSTKADVDKWAAITEYTGNYPHGNVDGLQGDHTCFNVYFGGVLVGIYVICNETLP